MDVVKSIGTGKDYTTVTAWEAASYGGTTSEDNAIGEIYGEVTESVAVIIDDATPLSITLTSVSSDRHNGSPGTGARIIWNVALSGACLTVSVTKSFTLSWLDIYAGQLNTRTIVYSTAGGPHYIINNIIHGAHAARNSTAAACLAIASTGSGRYVYNNLIFDYTNSISHARGIASASNGVVVIYNNTITEISGSSTSDAIGISILNDADTIFKNNLVSNVSVSGTGTASNYIGGLTHATNGSEDATSPNGAGYQNLTINFAEPGDYSPLATSSANVLSGGTDLGTTANIDLKGRDRDAQGDIWGLGAIQYIASGGSVFEGTFTTSLSMSGAFPGQTGTGGGLVATAGSAAYAGAGQDGTQGTISPTLAAIIAAHSGQLGAPGVLSGLIAQIMDGSGQLGSSGVAALTLAEAIPYLLGTIGTQGELAATISISAFFGQQAIFEGKILATVSELSSAITGQPGNNATLATEILVAVAVTGSLGVTGAALINQEAAASALAGVLGVSGKLSLSVFSGAEMAGKLGVSGEMSSIMAALGISLIEVAVGGQIHRIAISTLTGRAVILSTTGSVSISTTTGKILITTE